MTKKHEQIQNQLLNHIRNRIVSQRISLIKGQIDNQIWDIFGSDIWLQLDDQLWWAIREVDNEET